MWRKGWRRGVWQSERDENMLVISSKTLCNLVAIQNKLLITTLREAVFYSPPLELGNKPKQHIYVHCIEYQKLSRNANWHQILDQIFQTFWNIVGCFPQNISTMTFSPHLSAETSCLPSAIQTPGECQQLEWKTFEFHLDFSGEGTWGYKGSLPCFHNFTPVIRHRNELVQTVRTNSKWDHMFSVSLTILNYLRVPYSGFFYFDKIISGWL